MTIVKLISLVALLSNFVFAYDIIQIDVGNTIDFTGILEMKHNERAHKNSHGTLMAKALEDELKHQRSKPVKAKQIFWDHEINPRQSLLQALVEAYEDSPKVLSLSLGGKYFDMLEEALITVNTLNDTVVVAAAGNNGGGTIYYPANYDNPCILSVGTTENGRRTEYSNTGKAWLEYNKKDPKGTSSSTARMAGIVLQIRRQNPEMNCKDVVLTMRMLYGKVKK